MAATTAEGDPSPTTAATNRPEDLEAVAERGRKRLAHATASIDAVLDTIDDEADDAALRRARCAIRNAAGDFEEVRALAGTDGE